MNATDRLSRAASTIWRDRIFEDPFDALGRDADCGPMIDAAHRRYQLQAVADAGYATPAEYNADLRSRMVNADGTMSLRVHNLLMMLEIEDTCPSCGAALEVTSHWTRQYGGGYDTFVRCPACGYADAYV